MMQSKTSKKNVTFQDPPQQELAHIDIKFESNQFHNGGISKHEFESDIENSNNNNSNNSGNEHNDDEASLNSGLSSLTGAFKFRTSAGNLIVLILLLGVATSAGFLGVGLSSGVEQEEDQFHRDSDDMVHKIQSAFGDYVNAASLVHNRCRHRNFTRQDFRELYEYLIAAGLEFKAVQFDPNITREERATAEAEAKAFYAEHYPYVNYQGIRGFNTLNSTTLEPRTEQNFYFPIHYQEPIPGNEAAIDLDYFSSESRIRAVQSCLGMKQPSLTDRLSLVKTKGSVSRCGDHNGPSYGVVLMHPGIPLTTQSDIWPRDFSSIVLCIPDLLRRATSDQGEGSKIYIHDLSHPGGEPVFLGGALVNKKDNQDPELTFLDEVELQDLHGFRLYIQREISVANRIWTVTVIALEGTYEPNIIFVVLGGVIIFLASCCVALWVWTSSRRVSKFNEMKATAEAEKAALILDNARQATKAERELNDFIAHEVRNPVAAALTACSFVKTAVEKEVPLADEESRELARDDVNIIDKALRFVNDLLRNMLDMHRATNKQLQITMAPTDLLHDVLEPVAGMLHQRGDKGKVKLIVECPPNLFVMTDSLRLKQVILNLGRNSSKFIDEGFIRLKAEKVHGEVRLYVDDSGSGIPLDKRRRLFAKFQESLDSLSQGTGIGLFLCKHLVELMGGEISLDDDYNSGIPGHPGTRFVVNLKVSSIENPVDWSARLLSCNSHENPSTGDTTSEEDSSLPSELPEMLSVLFVDDDPILRKLFCRSIRTLVPGWSVREVANGEAALCLIEDHHFDLIFVDMYMASVEKQLLGTETVEAMRDKGITSRICGLSANDKESEFYDAGADAFMYKPFPCEAQALTRNLCRVLYEDRQDAQP